MKKDNIRYFIIMSVIALIVVGAAVCKIVFFGSSDESVASLKEIGRILLIAAAVVAGTTIIVRRMARTRLRRYTEWCSKYDFDFLSEFDKYMGMQRLKEDYETWAKAFRSEHNVSKNLSYRLKQIQRECVKNNELYKTVFFPCELGVVAVLYGQDVVSDLVMSSSTIIFTLVMMIFFGTLIKNNESVNEFVEDIAELEE